MKLTERQYEILNILKEEGKISVAELVERLFVCDMTIRRDLARLEHLRLIKRYRGGALLLDNAPLKLPIEMRMHLNDEEKRALAKMAEKYISDEQMIFLDSSSTCSYLIPFLKKHKNITVVTNSISTLLKLAEAGIQSISTGGRYYDTDMCFIGEETIDAIRNYRFDVAFFSTLSCDKDKRTFYDDDIHQTMVRRAATDQAAKNIFLIDNSKVNTAVGRYLVCKAELVHNILFI